MNTEKLFDFLLGENVNYVLKGSRGNILTEQNGILKLDKEGNLLLDGGNKEITIKVDKAEDIEVIELANYVCITYSSSAVELRKYNTKEEKLNSFVDMLQDTGCSCNLAVNFGNSTIYYMGELGVSIYEKDVVALEINELHFDFHLPDIDSLETEFGYDELMYIFKLKNNVELIIGFTEQEEE